MNDLLYQYHSHSASAINMLIVSLVFQNNVLCQMLLCKATAEATMIQVNLWHSADKIDITEQKALCYQNLYNWFNKSHLCSKT